MTLAETKKGSYYAVDKVCGDDKTRRRLIDMGFTPDSKFYVAHRGFFAGAVLAVFAEFSVAVRAEIATLVSVREVLK